MKWRDWLEEWGMTSLKLEMSIPETDWQPGDSDQMCGRLRWTNPVDPIHPTL